MVNLRRPFFSQPLPPPPPSFDFIKLFSIIPFWPFFNNFILCSSPTPFLPFSPVPCWDFYFPKRFCVLWCFLRYSSPQYTCFHSMYISSIVVNSCHDNNGIVCVLACTCTRVYVYRMKDHCKSKSNYFVPTAIQINYIYSTKFNH